MRLRLPCLALLALGTAWSLTAAQPPAKGGAAPVKSEPYDLVFLSQSRPLLVRLDVRMDGKSLHAAWDDFIDYLFKYADRDSDGTLSKDEADGAPPPSLLNGAALFGGGFGMMGRPGGGNLDANGDGKVTRTEFGAHYRRAFTAFQVHAGTRQDPGMDGFSPFQTNTPSPEALNKALLNLLDTSKDGKLSRQELAAARGLFHRLDLDEDEVITHRELLPDFTAFSIYGARRARAPGSNPPSSVPQDPVFLAPAGSSRSVAQALLARYGKDRARKTLARADVALDQETFGRLDRDGNGELDSEELARFTHRTPDLQCVVRIGERKPDDPLVEVIGGAGGQRLPGVEVRTSPEGVVLVFGKERLAIRVAEGKPRSQLGFILRAGYLQQFQQADRDNNGYIEEKEAQNSGLRTFFKMMDRDGDGKVYEKEVTAYVDTIEDLQTRATVATASLTFSDGGQGLFELFDSDRDGRLSLREINAMVRLVEELDRSGDGILAPDEIPHSYLFRLEQGAGGGAANPFAIFEMMGVQSGPLPPTGRGPQWFQKMDRNRDGDVSRAEFLGSADLFRHMDTDGDGLLSADEATRYQAGLGKRRRPKQ